MMRLAPQSAHHHHAHGISSGNSASHIAIRNGLWNESSTWGGGSVPGDGAEVMIPSGVTVTLASEQASRLGRVHIAGTLLVDDEVDTELRVETIFVDVSGLFQVGRAASPVQGARTATFTFIDTGPVSPSSGDPRVLRRGLVAAGRARIYGAPKQSFLTLATEPRRRDRELHLDSTPDTWRVGDVLLVPSVRFGKRDALQNETRVIEAIEGSRVVLDRRLEFGHPIDRRLKVHVANLTRNVVFRSESNEISRRGHVMLMDCGGTVVQGALFLDLGRTDKLKLLDDPVIGADGVVQEGTGTNPRGRYPLHLHECGLDSEAAEIRSSAVWGSPGWALVVHGSRAEVHDNVVYDFRGAGFVAEDGNEMGSFVGNLAAGGLGNGEFPIRRSYIGNGARINRADLGFHGDGFWLQSPFMSVQDNIAAGNKGIGFFYYTAGISPSGGVGMAGRHLGELDLRRVRRQGRRWGSTNLTLIVDAPIQRFVGNTAYGNYMGLKIRYAQSRNKLVYRALSRAVEQDIQGDAPDYLPYFIEDSSFWNNMVGIQASYSSAGRFEGIFVGTNIGDDRTRLNDGTWIGIESWHQSTRDMQIRGATIKGYPVGILATDEAHPELADVTYAGVEKAVRYNTDRSIRL